MLDVQLPIDVVPGTDPPVFRWRQMVESLGGERVVVDHQEALPPHVEQAVQRLVGVAKQLLRENMALQGQMRAAEDATAGAERNVRRVEREAPPTAPPTPPALKPPPRRGK